MLYSDGVTEGRNSENRLFSEDRLKEFLQAGNTKGAIAVIDSTMAAVRPFEGGAEQSDDITVVGLEFHGSSEDAPVVEKQNIFKRMKAHRRDVCTQQLEQIE